MWRERHVKVMICAAITLVVLLHIIFWSIKFPDFTLYLNPWLTYMRQHGPGSIGTEFANYHPPYLYIIWFVSLFVPDNLSVVKLTSIVIDMILAIAVYRVVRCMWRQSIRAWVAAVGVLLLPTVVINGAVWGQCDALFSAFLLFALAAGLKKKITVAWIMVAVAIAVKPQGVFFLPWLIYLSLYYRQGVKGVIAWAATLVSMLGVPVLFGLSPYRLVTYYLKDMQPMWGVKLLSWWCPNVMVWIPNSLFDIGRTVGLILFGGVLVLFARMGWRRLIEASGHSLMAVALLSCLLSVFVLPQMHERYYFIAEVLSWVIAVSVKTNTRRWMIIAVGMQLISFVGIYWMFISNMSQQFALYQFLSVGILGVIGMVLHNIYNVSKTGGFACVRNDARGILNEGHTEVR